tara:strand:- start:5792 stop:5974 length:183 start_codon:yes stop_codon:yes gene_type:complete
MEVGHLYRGKNRKSVKQLTPSDKRKVWELIKKGYTLKEMQRDTNLSYGAINSVIQNRVRS